MEYRILKEQEIDGAVWVARYVYTKCIEPYWPQPEMHRSFREYVDAAHLTQMVTNQQLIMWGAFDGTAICGVGAMQPEGHITMLYVLPQYQRRRIGRSLLGIMRKFAFVRYKHAKVTLSAVPSWTSAYFAKSGFAPMKLPQPVSPLIVPMEAKTDRSMEYKARPLSEKPIAITAAVFLGAILLMSVIFLLCYL